MEFLSWLPDQLLILSSIFECVLVFGHLVCTCVVDLEKGFYPLSVSVGELREFGVSGPLLGAIQSLYNCNESSTCNKLVLFPVGVGLCQGFFSSQMYQPSPMIMSGNQAV